MFSVPSRSHLLRLNQLAGNNDTSSYFAFCHFRRSLFPGVSSLRPLDMEQDLSQLLLRNARLEEATTNAVLSAEAALRQRAAAPERPLPDFGAMMQL